MSAMTSIASIIFSLENARKPVFQKKWTEFKFNDKKPSVFIKREKMWHWLKKKKHEMINVCLIRNSSKSDINAVDFLFVCFFLMHVMQLQYKI